jgi:thiol:disulfide interchange protein DsbD
MTWPIAGTHSAFRGDHPQRRGTWLRWVFGFWIAALALVAALSSGGARADDDFLDVEKAFVLRILTPSGQPARVRFDVAPGYYLYRERLSLALDGKALEMPPLTAGKRKFDEAFNKEVEVYYGVLEFPVPDTPTGRAARLEVGYQGCADKGLCYPPQVHTVMLEAGASTGGALTGEPGAASGAGLAGLVGAASAESEAGAESTAAAASASGSESNTGPLDEVLRTGKVLPVVGVFFLAGVLLSLTPCVLPMLPILSSIIVGQAPGSATTSPSRWRAFGLAAAYSLGMALVYSALGIAAGLAGEGLGAALQKPGVLVAFALAMGVLALSMFGAYELQLPQAWMARWSRASSRLPGGRVLGVFAMGGLSALIVSPCVAAPLAGALIYISQTRDVVLGGTALFSLAAGMSVPLLLLGASAGAWLPKAGAWMESVKTFFGVLLLAVAIWIVTPATGPTLAMALWGALLVLCAVFLWPHAQPAHHGARLAAQFARAASICLGLWGALQLWGAASGGRDPWQPLAVRAAVADGMESGRAAAKGPAFMPIRSVDELDAALAAADRPVLLDFYADWCRSCIEMEHKTYADPQIAQRLSKAVLLKADVTANNAADQALLKRFGLFGPPAALFFEPGAGQTQFVQESGQKAREPAVRVIGFEPPQRFAQSLSRVGL